MLTNKASAPTTVMPKYQTDGHGRDTFITFAANDRSPPLTLKPCALPTAKFTTAKHPALPKFVPCGNGRDMFCQVNSDKVYPHNSKGMTSNPNPLKKQKGTGVSRTTRPPTYRPSGTGRDLYYTSNDAGVYSVQSTSFKTGHATKIPRPRTSPPPKFAAIGSGRDTYQNPNAFRLSTPVREKDQGFAYGSSFLSKTARYAFKGDVISQSPKAQLESTLRLAQSPISKNHPLQRPLSST